ncbi:MAG: hypothetical protein IJ255_07260 [Bacteroidales bacterium]|nr:hypothetical protein [Bacteroidales bacterium]
MVRSFVFSWLAIIPFFFASCHAAVEADVHEDVVSHSPERIQDASLQVTTGEISTKQDMDRLAARKAIVKYLKEHNDDPEKAEGRRHLVEVLEQAIERQEPRSARQEDAQVDPVQGRPSE